MATDHGASRHDSRSELAQLLRDPDAQARVRAIRALAQRPGPDVFKSLVAVLDDASPSVRVQAAAALVASDSQAAPHIVKRLMADELRTVRFAIVELLVTGVETGLWFFLDASKSNNERVRESSIWGLAYFADGESVDRLIEALSDVNANVRYYAADSLSIIRPKRALASLVLALQRQPESDSVLGSISDAIASIGGQEARRLLLDCMAASNENAKKWARVALEDIDATR
jgi:HEAT repeat protein